MKCQYCNNIIVPLPVDGICPNCNKVLQQMQWHSDGQSAFPEPPVGMYSSEITDYIIIGEDHVKLYANYGTNQIVDCQIPFEQICDVKYIPGTVLKVGLLCVRARKDASIPMPATLKEAIRDSSTIRFDPRGNEKFYYVYSFLKKCVDVANGTQ